MTAKEFIDSIMIARGVQISEAVKIAADILKVNTSTPWKWLSGKLNPSRQTLALMEMQAKQLTQENKNPRISTGDNQAN